ncbi:MAG: helix-hairpin-helix domain-containing protein [Porphyromonas sp.]|nr:helix-hairpin-helix domain-containing protein [Porphyromonas sp.]
MNNWLHIGKSELVVLAIAFVAAIVLVLTLEGSPKGRASDVAQPVTAGLDADSIVSKTQKGGTAEKLSQDTFERSADYVGPPQHIHYKPKESLPIGSVLELNVADSATLTRVPGIGPAFARRIVAYRERLGGYYTLLQLQEIYGMTYERYLQIKPYFTIHRQPTKILLRQSGEKELPKHPYLNYKQRTQIERLLRYNGYVSSWQQLIASGLFNKDDSIRLSHYFAIPNSIIDSATSESVPR